jgi:hypothetical protein
MSEEIKAKVAAEIERQQAILAAKRRHTIVNPIIGQQDLAAVIAGTLRALDTRPVPESELQAKKRARASWPMEEERKKQRRM